MSKKILIVEDEFFIAASLQSDITSLGHEVVGPAPNCNDALKLISKTEIDFATLDVNLGNETSQAVAKKLVELDVPFVFVTGYTGKQMDMDYFDKAILPKPVDFHKLREVLESHFGAELTSVA